MRRSYTIGIAKSASLTVAAHLSQRSAFLLSATATVALASPVFGQETDENRFGGVYIGGTVGAAVQPNRP
jgi:hypothetical protein